MSELVSGIDRVGEKWTTAEYAFAAAWRIVQAAGEIEGIYFGEMRDHLTVLRHAAELELPGAAEELEGLLARDRRA